MAERGPVACVRAACCAGGVGYCSDWMPAAAAVGEIRQAGRGGRDHAALHATRVGRQAGTLNFTGERQRHIGMTALELCPCLGERLPGIGRFATRRQGCQRGRGMGHIAGILIAEAGQRVGVRRLGTGKLGRLRGEGRGRAGIIATIQQPFGGGERVGRRRRCCFLHIALRGTRRM